METIAFVALGCTSSNHVLEVTMRDGNKRPYGSRPSLTEVLEVTMRDGNCILYLFS